MKEITVESETHRIFYMHDFMYFLDFNPSSIANAIEELLCRVLELMILFDKILIPAEHLIICQSEAQVNFREKFFSNHIIQSLIEKRIIITTIWDCCSDFNEFYQAMSRYMNSVEAIYMQPSFKGFELKSFSVYKRNQSSQSESAKEITLGSEWQYSNQVDSLQYRDGDIEISFSHESLLLGQGRKVFLDKRSILAAKRAYIYAMPSGNGNIYRAQVPELEICKRTGKAYGSPCNTLLPVMFSQSVYKRILEKIGFLFEPKILIKTSHWVDSFLSLAEFDEFKKLRSIVFKSIVTLSKFYMPTNEDLAKECLDKNIYYYKIWNLLSFLRELNKLNLPSGLIDRACKYEIGARRDGYYKIPSGVVYEFNCLTKWLSEGHEIIHQHS
jgi:hypothetical protein